MPEYHKLETHGPYKGPNETQTTQLLLGDKRLDWTSYYDIRTPEGNAHVGCKVFVKSHHHHSTGPLDYDYTILTPFFRMGDLEELIYKDRAKYITCGADEEEYYAHHDIKLPDGSTLDGDFEKGVKKLEEGSYLRFNEYVREKVKLLKRRTKQSTIINPWLAGQ